MTQRISKLNLHPICFQTACNCGWFLFLVLMMTGCTTAAYKSSSAAGPAKPADYPIPIYKEQMRVPRPCRLIGVVSVNAGGFTLFGGSAEAEMAKVMRKAHQKGADAVKLISIEKPDFANPNYRLQAQLLRYTDVWENLPMSLKEFQTYLATNRQNLDSIEGIWFSSGLNGLSPHTIGIMRNSSRPGRDFVGFILDTHNPIWHPGDKKIDIRRGLERGSYVFTYYLDDFARGEVPLHLNGKPTFSIDFQKGEEHNLITYIKQ